MCRLFSKMKTSSPTLYEFKTQTILDWDERMDEVKDIILAGKSTTFSIRTLYTMNDVLFSMWNDWHQLSIRWMVIVVSEEFSGIN